MACTNSLITCSSRTNRPCADTFAGVGITWAKATSHYNQHTAHTLYDGELIAGSLQQLASRPSSLQYYYCCTAVLLLIVVSGREGGIGGAPVVTYLRFVSIRHAMRQRDPVITTYSGVYKKQKMANINNFNQSVNQPVSNQIKRKTEKSGLQGDAVIKL